MEESVFNSYFKKYYKTVVNFLYRKTEDKDLAVDLASETFTIFYTSCKDYNEIASKSYLFTVAINQFMQYVRTRKKQREFEAYKSFSGEPVSDPLHDMIRMESYLGLYEAIDKLPEGRKKVIKMHFLDGMSVKEIAATTGMPIGTVKTNRYYSLKFLRDFFGVTHAQWKENNLILLRRIFSSDKSNKALSRLYGKDWWSIDDIKKNKDYSVKK